MEERNPRITEQEKKGGSMAKKKAVRKEGKEARSRIKQSSDEKEPKLARSRKDQKDRIRLLSEYSPS